MRPRNERFHIWMRLRGPLKKETVDGTSRWMKFWQRSGDGASDVTSKIWGPWMGSRMVDGILDRNLGWGSRMVDGILDRNLGWGSRMMDGILDRNLGWGSRMMDGILDRNLGLGCRMWMGPRMVSRCLLWMRPPHGWDNELRMRNEMKFRNAGKMQVGR